MKSPTTRSGQGPDSPKILVSLAVIVRNQADLLERLLRNHQALYDEAVVVDTGSLDSSAGVAADCGARVIRERWRDDFSLARNRALSHCRGRWILVLDCDEALDEPTQRLLRHDLECRQDGALALEQRNYTWRQDALEFVPDPMARSTGCGAPGYIPRRQVRVIPGGSGILYSGRIHETVEESLARHSVAIEYLGLPVHHFGHVEGRRGHMDRRRRNGSILRKACLESPHDPVLLTDYAAFLLGEGQISLAARMARRALKVAPRHPELFRTRLLLARMASSDSPGMATEWAEAALRDRPDQAACWVEAARSRLRLGQNRIASKLANQGSLLFPADPVLASIKTQVSEVDAEL